MKEIIWNYKPFEELTVLELYQITRLRNEVFVVEQDCVYQDLDGKDLFCSHLWATIDGQVVAYCRIVPKGVSYENEPSIGRVITNMNYRGEGLGVQLIKNAIQIIENGFETCKIRISAQSYLKSFYGSFGFVQVSDEYLEDNLPHMEMLRK